MLTRHVKNDFMQSTAVNLEFKHTRLSLNFCHAVGPLCLETKLTSIICVENDVFASRQQRVR